MFWSLGTSNKLIDPIKKFKFIAEFDTLLKSDSNRLNALLYEPNTFRYLVKKIDLPKINLEFERSYANEYVHYFQNGPINWEPINITFVDISKPVKDSVPNLRQIFNDYINSSIQQNNRTNLVDLPVFCNQITIESYGNFIDNNYPKGAAFIKNSELSTGQKIEEYLSSKINQVVNRFIIKKPRLSKIDFGSLDYGSDEINDINVTVIPEWCEVLLD